MYDHTCDLFFFFGKIKTDHTILWKRFHFYELHPLLQKAGEDIGNKETEQNV